MQLKERIDLVLSFEKSKAKWRNKFDSVERIQTSSLHYSLFGEHLSKSKNCGCIDDFFHYLFSLKNNEQSINQKQNQMNTEFSLKKGKVIMLHGFNEVVTKDNLTDAKALEILRKYPAHISSFEKFPENWQELTGKEVKEDKKDPFKADFKNDVDKQLLNTLKGKKLKDLQTEASPYPKEEWESLKHKDLVNYLFSKIKESN